MPGFDYADLGGGINAGAAPAAIASREMAELINWYPDQTRLRRRGGISLVGSGGIKPTSLFPLHTSAGDWTLLVGGPTGFGRLDGSAIVDLPSSVSLPSSFHPWVMFQYKDHVYALRKDTNVLLRLAADSVALAGLAAPSSAATIAEGAAGALPSGNYKAVYTNYNIATAMESNPSPVSNTLALTASKQINYTGIDVSPNGFVTARRIYRTLENQSGVYFFVAQINDNVTTTFTGDNVVVADLGGTVSFDNGMPPGGLESGVIWNERLFATDGVDLFFSSFLNIEAFGDENVISVYKDDGHRMRGLLAHGDRLIIGKTNKIHYLLGDSLQNFGLHTLSDRHGCLSGPSMKSALGSIFWYGTGDAVYRSDGTSPPVEISTPRVKPYLEMIPPGLEEFVTATIYAPLNWYLLSIPTVDNGDGTPFRGIILCYNYKDNTWAVFRTSGGNGFGWLTPSDYEDAFLVLGDFYDANNRQLLYVGPCSFDKSGVTNRVFLFNDPLADYDFVSVTTGSGASQIARRPLRAAWRTKADDFGYPGYRKYFKEVWLATPQQAADVKLDVFLEDEATALLSRTVSLDIEDSEFKPYTISHARQPGTRIQLRGETVGGLPTTLDQLHFEVGLLGRRPGQPR